MRLTTSRYYTPTGRSIQKPYSKNDTNGNYNKDYQNRINNGELFTKDSIKVNDSLKFVTPKGKIVYGGGGIVPDVFVPVDTLNIYSHRLYSRLNGFSLKPKKAVYIFFEVTGYELQVAGFSIVNSQ